MKTTINAVGNVLLQLPNNKFYVLSAVITIAMIVIAFVFRNHGKK